MKVKSLVFIFSMFISVTAIGQQNAITKTDFFNQYTKLLSPEKVYLHTDKDAYFATDTIWFSGYVENASYASEFDESNYIYVELICDELQRSVSSLKKYAEYKSNVSVRKKIKRVDNSFQGHIVVPELNSTGRAVIRAYTYWMLNRPAEYMFYKELEVANPMKDKLIDEMAKKQIKHNKDYLLMGEMSPEEKLKNQDKKDLERYDVQFLPESGNYVYGQKAVMYVKAVGTGGAGVQVFGEIYNSKDEIVGKYRTDDSGFARAVLEIVDNKKFYATVKDTLGYEGEKVKLYEPLDKGITINGRMIVSGNQEYSANDRVVFSINIHPDLLDNTLAICFHNGSEIYYCRNLSKRVETAALNLKSLTPGIHSISVIDNNGNVYAERPFVVLPTGGEPIDVITEQKRYGKRELVNIKINVPTNLLDSTSNFSVAVTDSDLASNSEKTTMQSYMLLKSELRGYVENIEWYFNDTISLAARMLKADLLMQTQGWRYYDIEKILKGKTSAPNFGREYTQTIAGKVVNPIGLTRKATVSFLAPSINFKAIGQIDSGFFVLNNVDFPEETRFIVSAIGKNGKSQIHTPVLQNDIFAPVIKYPVKTERVTYSKPYSNIVEKIYYEKDDGEHSMAYELDPVVVTSQFVRLKNSPSPLPEFPLKREWVRDSIDMKSYSRNYTVSSYVVATYPGVREYYGQTTSDYVRKPQSEGDGIPYGSLIGPKWSPGSMSAGVVTKPSRWGLVLVYLNGTYIPAIGGQALHQVLNLPLSDVESIIYVSGASASTFQPAFTADEVSPYPVLMVRTKPHVRTDQVPYNVSGGYPLGWQKPARFYSPKYDTPESKRSKAKDNRITLYWNPAVKLDENGEATISFYTSDSDSQYRIEVEGRSAARQYHYAEKIIERKVEDQTGKKK